MQTIKNKRALIYASSGLSIDDINVLSLLYEPLIGPEALTLYLNFMSLVRKNKFNNLDMNHQDIFDILNFSEQKFLNSRYKLEGMGLLSTYQNEDAIAYVIYLPLPPDQFVKSSSFGIYLNHQVGEENLKKIIDLFKVDKLNKSSFENVTKQFDDVFTIASLDRNENIDSYLDGVKRAKSFTPISTSFSFDKFVSLIDLSYLPQGPNKTFENNIMSYATAYNLDLEDCIKAYTQSIGANKEFNMRLFKVKAETIYNMKNNEDTIPTLVDKTNLAEKEDIYQRINNLSIDELIQEAQILDTATNRGRIAEVYNSIKLNRTILNMMIISACKDKSSVPTITYFEKMYNTMSEKNVLDIRSAEKYLFGSKEEIKNNTNKKVKNNNKNDEPEWLSGSIEKLLKGLSE